MTMIERVAKAIAIANEDELHWKGYIVNAKAAIAAMRVPTEAMANAPHSDTDAWRAMIEVALHESETK